MTALAQARAWLAARGVQAPRRREAVLEAIAVQDRQLLAHARELNASAETALVEAQRGRDLAALLLRGGP